LKSASEVKVKGTLVLYAFHGFNAFLVWMFDLSHLRDKVRKGNKLFTGITAGDDDVQLRGFLFQKCYNLVLVEKAVIQGIGELVQDYHAVFAALNLFPGETPALFRCPA
jgi:hypothetical protein